MTGEVDRSYGARRRDGGFLDGSILAIRSVNGFFVGTESPDSQCMVSGMAALRGKLRPGDNRLLALLVKPFVIEKDMPPLMILSKNILQRDSRVCVSSGKDRWGMLGRGGRRCREKFQRSCGHGDTCERRCFRPLCIIWRTGEAS